LESLGTSNAFAISKKLGISEEIIARAKSRLNDTEVHIEDLLKEIYDDKRTIEKEKQEALENSRKAEELKLSLDKKYEDLMEKEISIINSAKEKASNILLDAKEDANEIIRNLENTKSSKEANSIRNDLNKKLQSVSYTNVSNSNDSNEKLDASKISKGDEVFVPKLNQNGTILSINGSSAMVQVGIMKSSFKISDLTKAKNTASKQEQNLKSIKREFKVQSISPEINVLGQNVDEACFVIDKYLDTCSLNGLNQVRIVHGKGTGALRKGIHTFLRTHPHVKSFRLGTFGEGEMGVTIVELK
jgi:DNA mismatch repair protein MutS2